MIFYSPYFFIKKGNSAFSLSTQKKLLKNLLKIDIQLTQIQTQYIYFIWSKKELDISEQKILDRLLNDNTCSQEKNRNTGEKFESIIIYPRIGTISSWSNKAKGITDHCGFSFLRIERGIQFSWRCEKVLEDSKRSLLFSLLHDRMTESILEKNYPISSLYQNFPDKNYCYIDILNSGKKNLLQVNQEMGLALSDKEISHFFQNFINLRRNPSDVEFMMFAQVNSEHCRHKIFNAAWIIDNVMQDSSLFQIIKNTHKKNPDGVLVAYSDNSAIIKRRKIDIWSPDQKNLKWNKKKRLTHTLFKVETHNHPTAISPYSGACTGAGGEIRDEGATGIGGKPKAGLVGFSVSNLFLPKTRFPWENKKYGKPENIASALEIIISGSLGSAAFNNEFGRPILSGYFRVFEQTINQRHIGYHKPIMISGGIGLIDDVHIYKKQLESGDLLIQLGGSGMRIGMGGATASSALIGINSSNLDFNSVQRANPELSRRAQEVINVCRSMYEENPILSIHDVGAGGLSNAIPEIIYDSNLGVECDIQKIPIEESGMTPAEIWCNESQERYVLVISKKDLSIFENICRRERCPMSVIGFLSEKKNLILKKNNNIDCMPINMSLETIFCDIPKMNMNVKSVQNKFLDNDFTDVVLVEAIEFILQHPTVSSKSFLITICDRTIGGLSVRDQFVGPWQVPTADAGVTLMDYTGYYGEAISIGERAPISIINAASAARMAVAEAITNILSADIRKIEDIKLAANWMAASGIDGEDAKLFESVKAVGMELCPMLGISIPVGKDSLSMKTQWTDEKTKKIKTVIAPISLIVSAVGPVHNIKKCNVPLLITKDKNQEIIETDLILIDLGKGLNRMGGSILSQIYSQIGNHTPDLDSPQDLKNLFNAINELRTSNILLAYHDRSDGGLFTTIAEMAFTSHLGISINIDMLLLEKEHEYDYGDAKDWTRQIKGRRHNNILKVLFNEELGVVLQTSKENRKTVFFILKKYNLYKHSYIIGSPNHNDQIEIWCDTKKIFSEKREILHKLWQITSWNISRIRDNPICADSEYNLLDDTKNPGIQPILTFDLKNEKKIAFIKKKYKQNVAILREQGTNSQSEMSYVIDRAGFNSYDVHMSDIFSGLFCLKNFRGLIVCGGFSYGDTLGAGIGWAKSILFNSKIKDQFQSFFERNDTFGLGICNGCQMLSHLKSIIPGAETWPKFTRNLSDQHESRFVMVKIGNSPSIFLHDMIGSYLPIPVSHGEGFAEFSQFGDLQQAKSKNLISLQFVDHYGEKTEQYPFNPNGSVEGITGLTTTDGRFTIMMPHPERVFRITQMSWYPKNWENICSNDESPWMRMFYNAKIWSQ